MTTTPRRPTPDCDALMSRHTAAWQAATVQPFLEGVRDGSLPEHSFDRWLALNSSRLLLASLRDISSRCAPAPARRRVMTPRPTRA
jgi:hypothetical protein